MNVLDDSEPKTGINWETLAETFEKSGISWKVYMELDNFDDNAFNWFEQFYAAKPGDPLYEKGMRRSLSLINEFRSDVANDKLPQVSFIISPAWLSEHAHNHP